MNSIENSVPIIDIHPFLGGSPGDRARVVAQVKRACEEIGFLSIVGHQVAPGLVDEMRSASDGFFDLPAAEKVNYKRAPGVGTHGYAGLFEGSLAYTLGVKTPPDYKESLSVGPEVPADDPYYQTEDARQYFMPNVWPERPPELRAIYLRYYTAVEQLASTIMRIFALALDLPEDFFSDKLDRPVNHLLVIRYPAQTVPPEEGQLRSGAHTDFGTLTILLAEDKPGGLQVRRRDGQWIDVHPVPNSFIINIGDMMMRWTNDHWLSNLHRVTNPPPEFASIPRLSVVFFQKPNHDATIACIERYSGEANVPKYAPTLASEMWVSKNTKLLAGGKP